MLIDASACNLTLVASLSSRLPHKITMAPIIDRTSPNDVSRPDLSPVADMLVLGCDK